MILYVTEVKIALKAFARMLVTTLLEIAVLMQQPIPFVNMMTLMAMIAVRQSHTNAPCI